MGIDYNLYVGPYAEIRCRMIQEKQDDCGNPDECPNPTNGYCPECGIHVGSRFRVREVWEHETCPEELFGGWALTTADGMGIYESEVVDGQKYNIIRYIPNEKRSGPSRTMYLGDPCRGEDTVEDWSEINPKEELKWFQKAFSKELMALGKNFDIEYKWGYLNWAS